MTLGMWYRRVTVDVVQKEIAMRSHWLWVFARSRRIPFESVAAVTYGYSDLSRGGDLVGAHDSVAVFAVELRLRDDREVHLFTLASAF
jgi:hypothetical protein